MWDGVSISHGDVVYWATITTDALRAIFLNHYDDWYRTRIKSFTYVPFVEELSDLSVYFFGLLGIDAVGCLI